MAEDRSRGAADEYYNSAQQPGYQQQEKPVYQQQGQQNYNPPPNPPPQQYTPPSYPPPQKFESGQNFQYEEAFKVEKPKWNDLWAGILFLLVCGGFIAVSGIAIQGYAATYKQNGTGIYNGTNDFGLNTNTILLFVFVIASASVMSYAYVWLARLFPIPFIWVTGILNIIYGFVLAIYMFTRKSWGGAVVFLLFAVFTVICFISWIPRIPFSAFMLKTSINVSKRYGHVYIVSLIGGLFGMAFAAYFSVTLVAIYAKYEPGNNPACNTTGSCSSATVIGLIVFITFAAFWISEWLKNTIHTTVAGVYGSWYFYSDKTPKGATRGAFKRAVTYSFGSISLGSLIVAIVNLLRWFASLAQQEAAQDGNIFAVILICCLRCLLSCLEWVIEFVNRYAFITIALYGKSYFAAAKDTWTFIKQRGIDALINMCLIGPVLNLGAMFIGFSSALLAYLYVLFTDPAYNKTGTFTPVIVAFSFLVGVQICNVFTVPISSGVDTIFVAAAWDPEVLQQQHPELYAEMLRVYPQLSDAIHA